VIKAPGIVGLVGLVSLLAVGTATVERSPEPRAPAVTAAPDPENPPYDGRYGFVRIRYGGRENDMRGGFRYGRGREPMWAHDHPRAETNFLRIMQELTSVPTAPEYHLVLDADDPELFRHAVAYIVEVGYWHPTDAEVEALRTWLLKGGFLIVDDFRGDHLENFATQMQRVLPGMQFQRLDREDEIFDSFFHISDPYSLMPPYDQRLVPVYLGVFEENDRAGRLMVIANYNQDHMEYWEFSDYGYYPIDLSNEAYKFGVNYVVYGLTH
jgi:hypothetical protein